MITNKFADISLKFIIIFRLYKHVGITQRLIGTRVYLYDADGTKQIAECDKITKVNTAYGEGFQTYTLPCDSPCSTSYVKLEDSEIGSNDKNIIMNIAEVGIYGTDRPLNCHGK